MADAVVVASLVVPLYGIGARAEQLDVLAEYGGITVCERTLRNRWRAYGHLLANSMTPTVRYLRAPGWKGGEYEPYSTAGVLVPVFLTWWYRTTASDRRHRQSTDLSCPSPTTPWGWSR